MNNLKYFFAILPFCLTSAYADQITPYNSTPQQMNYQMFANRIFEIGLLAGATSANTSGSIIATGTNFPAAGSSFTAGDSSTNGEIGVQMREIINTNGHVQPFFYLNALSILGSTSAMQFGPLISGASSSKLANIKNWLMTLGIGVQSGAINHSIHAGIGIGMACVAQNFKIYISEPGGVTPTFHNFIASMQPSAMANLSWQFCHDCMGGYPATLAMQLSVNRYPAVTVNGTSSTGNFYSAQINRHWAPHGDLILNVQLPS